MLGDILFSQGHLMKNQLMFNVVGNKCIFSRSKTASQNTSLYYALIGKVLTFVNIQGKIYIIFIFYFCSISH